VVVANLTPNYEWEWGWWLRSKKEAKKKWEEVDEQEEGKNRRKKWKEVDEQEVRERRCTSKVMAANLNPNCEWERQNLHHSSKCNHNMPDVSRHRSGKAIDLKYSLEFIGSRKDAIWANHL